MLKRRDFLRATLITAGVAILPGCGEESVPQPPPVVVPRQYTDGITYFPHALASGDPKSDSVILWTRLSDSNAPEGEDLKLEVQVATDMDFTQLVALDDKAKAVQVLAKYDHCVKVKVTQLTAATVYYYRFVYVQGDKNFVSQVGRTKTAPAADADVAVKFAFVSCQDYIGRFYNSYVALQKEDIDFFVHLGDYVYETTGDPSFQSTTGRAVKFQDEAGALTLGSADKTYFAAKTLSNYRELYKTYRSDKNLQAMHMNFPMIAIWDDHEYSNDCFGANATYFNGVKSELDEARRKAANQAWFEYQPVDYADAPDFAYDESAAYPKDIKIYRDFVFGKHVHLVMTDLRTHRTDHLIPEDAFPGEVVLDTATLTTELGAVPPGAIPYIEVETFLGGMYKPILTAAAAVIGYDPAKVKGNLSAVFINQLGAQWNPMLPGMQIPVIDATAQAALDKGFSYFELGKVGFYSAIGSRYLVVKDTFDLYGKIKYKLTAGASEDVLGKDQETWFLTTMQNSTATWKVWGSEFSLNQLAVDLSPFDMLPPAFRRSFHLNVDDWNGSRNKRSELIEKLAVMGGVVTVSGDIHASFAGTPTGDTDPTKKIVEFIGPGISSSTFKAELKSQLAADPVLSMIPGTDLLVEGVDGLLQSPQTKTNPNLGFADSGANGYALVSASGDEFVVTMRLLPGTKVDEDFTDTPEKLPPFIKTVKLKTVKGGSDLYQEIEGVWKKWDSATQQYV